MFIVLFVFVVAFVCVYVLDWWSSGNGFHRTLPAEQWCCPMWNEIRFHFVWKSSNIHQTGHITWILPRSPGPTWPRSWWPPQQPPPRPTPDCSKPTRGQPSSLSHRFIWKRSRPMRMRTNTELTLSILFSAAILSYFRWLSGEKQGWVLCVWLGGGACGRPAVSSSSELGAPTAQPHTQPGEVAWDNMGELSVGKTWKQLFRFLRASNFSFCDWLLELFGKVSHKSSPKVVSCLQGACRILPGGVLSKGWQKW